MPGVQKSPHFTALNAFSAPSEYFYPNRELDAPLLVKHRSIVLKGFFGIKGSLKSHSKRLSTGISCCRGGVQGPLTIVSWFWLSPFFYGYRHFFLAFARFFWLFPTGVVAVKSAQRRMDTPPYSPDAAAYTGPPPVATPVVDPVTCAAVDFPSARVARVNLMAIPGLRQMFSLISPQTEENIAEKKGVLAAAMLPAANEGDIDEDGDNKEKEDPSLQAAEKKKKELDKQNAVAFKHETAFKQADAAVQGFVTAVSLLQIQTDGVVSFPRDSLELLLSSTKTSTIIDFASTGAQVRNRPNYMPSKTQQAKLGFDLLLNVPRFLPRWLKSCIRALLTTTPVAQLCCRLPKSTRETSRELAAKPLRAFHWPMP